MCTKTRIYPLPTLDSMARRWLSLCGILTPNVMLPVTDDPDAEYFYMDSNRMENNRHNDRVQSSAKGPIKAYEGKIISNEHRSRFVNFSPCNSDSSNNALHYQNQPASYGLD